jgi:hypothetical protein
MPKHNPSRTGFRACAPYTLFATAALALAASPQIAAAKTGVHPDSQFGRKLGLSHPHRGSELGTARVAPSGTDAHNPPNKPFPP